MREIVFAHIPKTAGTSLRNGLVDALDGHFHLFDYGPNSAQTTENFADVIFGNPSFKGLRERFPDDQGVFVSGHFGIKKYWNVFHPSSFIVFVRNPVQRLLSEYFHFVRNYDYPETLETFIDNNRFKNVLYKHFNVEIAKIGFIGDADNYNESVSALSDRLGVTIPQRRDNTGGGERYQEILSDDGRMAHIARENREDIDFHRYLVDEVIPRNWARNTEPISARRVTGTVDRTSPDRIDGVAFDLEGIQLIVVDIFIGDRKIMSVLADQYVEDLRTTRRVTSGVGGFSVSLDQLANAGIRPAPGTPIRFSAHGKHLGEIALSDA